MAQHLSAVRQARKALKNRARNRVYLSRMRNAVRKLRNMKEKDKAVVELKKVVKLLDQLAAKKIIHPNNASNKKSSLMKYVASLK